MAEKRKSSNTLDFKLAKGEKDYKEILDYSIDAFSDSPDFSWNMDAIKQEVKDGWKVGAVLNKKEIIAAIFYKIDKEGKQKVLSTKNTAIKFNHQGSGHSHSIKEYFEDLAKENKVNVIRHYCRIDNFRAYSLNESHSYKKTANTFDNGLIVEWEKSVK
jgi:hypothetical protein